MKKIFIIFVLSVVFPTCIFASSFDYTWSTIDLTQEVSTTLGPEGPDDLQNPLNLDCGSCILMEQKTGQILYSYNSHEKLCPASVTKLMSLYLIMEAISQGKINYDTQIPCSENASSMGGSQIWLDTTETLSVNEMLKAICVVSANDCVVAMAEYIAGTEEGFVSMMNQKAKDLGMNDTCFKNCHGIDEENHVMSSYDIAVLSRELLNTYPEITNYTTIYMDSLRDGKSSLVNTNKLVRNYKGCTGLKTGSTSNALYNLSASATRDGVSLIAVIMKAPTSSLRFSNASSLLDYGFSNFEYKPLIEKNAVVKCIDVNKGISHSVNAISQSSLGCIVAKGHDVAIEQTITTDSLINAPVLAGDVIGKITFSLNSEVIAEGNLIADESINKANLISMSKHLLQKWSFLLRIV